MDYISILKRTWQIVLKRPYFWLAGLLAGGGGFSLAITSVPSPGSFNFEKLFSKAQDLNQAGESFLAFIQHNWSLILVGIIIISVICLILFVLSFAAKAGLVKTVFELEKDREESNFFKLIGEGFEYFWRVLVVSLIVFTVILAVVGILSLPMALGVISPLFVIGWSMVSVLILLASFFFAEVVHLVLVREIVINNSSISESIKNGWKFFKNQFVQLILALLVFILVYLVASFGIGFASLVYLLIGGLIFWLAYVISSTASVVIGIVLGLILIIFILVASGFISSFRSSYWTLVYGKLKEII
jgi:hypothetical protein